MQRSIARTAATFARSKQGGTDSHWQLDLNYTQNIRLRDRVNLQIVGDLFNVFDKQTGYDIQPQEHNSAFGQARKFFDPRRLQVAARLQF